MSKIKKLIDCENNLSTDKGGSYPGKRVVFRGKDLFSELNTSSWMEVLLLGITGRVFTPNQVKLFEGMWVITASYPDPRIWNNRVTSLGGSTRSTGNLAIGAAISVSEATNYGQRPLIKAIDFLYDCNKHIDKGLDLNQIVFAELEKQRMLSGFGRPIVNKDERIKPLFEFARKLGFGDGKYVKLIFEIEELLQKSKYKFTMNAAGLDAALAADQGLTPREFYNFMTLCFTAGFFPCYIDATEKDIGSFYPFRCNRVLYQGIDKRKW